MRSKSDSPETERASTDFKANLKQAESIVDTAADRVEHYAGKINSRLRYLMARTREEAEDIWADAQTLHAKRNSQDH